MPALPHVARAPALVMAVGVIATALALGQPMGRALAAGPGDPGDPLSATMLDVALVQQAPDLPPDLLVVEPDDETRGTLKVGLLHRNRGQWQIAAAKAVPVDVSSPDVPAPWLVALGQGSFALISASADGSSTDIVPLMVGASGPFDLQVGPTVQTDFTVTDAVAADVDAGGDQELVVSSTGRGQCADTTMAVLAGPALEERRRWTVRQLRLAGAAIGRFDTTPGTDLLANAYETCPGVLELGYSHHLIGIRLADGGIIFDDQAQGPEDDPVGAPLVIDVDGDGHDEAVVANATDVAVIDPTGVRTSTPLEIGAAMALVSLADPVRIVWVAPDADRPAGVTTIEAGTTDFATFTDFSFGFGGQEALTNTIDRIRRWAGSRQQPPAEILDLDGDGCPELVMPGVIADCLDFGSLDAGPDWLATVPLAAFDGPGGRTVLTALGLEWTPDTGYPADPSPVAASARGIWRHGPSVSFRLTEVPASLVLRPESAPPPTIDATVAPGGAAAIRATPGARLLVQARPLDPGDDVADVTLAASRFLSGPTDVNATAFMTPPIESGNGRSATFDVLTMPRADGSRADRWLVDVLQIDSVGNVTGPVRETVVLDATPPTLAVREPFLTAPWPFRATLHGDSEAGAEVRIGDDPPVQADTNGTFQVDVALAPWPQTLEFTTTDAHGNATTARVSVMGGLDVRQLPWAIIATVTFLLAAVVASMRGVRRGRPTAASRSRTDELPLPEIEELPVGAQPRD